MESAQTPREHKGSQDVVAYEKTSNFEVIVGRSMPEDRALRYLGLVHGYDRKPKRRLVDLLQSQGLCCRRVNALRFFMLSIAH